MSTNTKITFTLLIQLLPVVAASYIVFSNLQPVSLPDNKSVSLTKTIFHNAFVFEILSSGTDDDCDEIDFNSDSLECVRIPSIFRALFDLVHVRYSPFKVFASGLEKNKYLITTTDLPPPLSCL